MNKQRKVLITTTYNEMGIIIDTKAEEVAQSNLQPTCNNLATDTISRQAAIDLLEELETKRLQGDVGLLYAPMIKGLKDLPSAQPEQSSEIQDILDYLDTVLHPIVSPENWNVYAELHDMISMLPSAQTKQLQILADVLDGCPLTQPCDKMWKPDGWCKEHCKTHEPDAECWLKYAEVMASDDETNTSDLQKLHMKRESIL